MFGLDDMTTGLVGGLAGGVLNNYMSGQRQQEAEQFNAAQAQKQMDFQANMSNTAYQRSMADMKTAGLNPILAYQKGGASSPSGAMASTQAAAVHDVVGPAISSAQAGERLQNEVESMKAETENKKMQNYAIQEDIHNKAMDTELKRDQRVQLGAQTANINAETANKSEELRRLMSEASKSETDKQFYDSKFGTFMRMLGNTGGEVGRVFTGSGGRSSDQYGNNTSRFNIGVR